MPSHPIALLPGHLIPLSDAHSDADAASSLNGGGGGGAPSGNGSGNGNGVGGRARSSFGDGEDGYETDGGFGGGMGGRLRPIDAATIASSQSSVDAYIPQPTFEERKQLAQLMRQQQQQQQQYPQLRSGSQPSTFHLFAYQHGERERGWSAPPKRPAQPAPYRLPDEDRFVGYAPPGQVPLRSRSQTHLRDAAVLPGGSLPRDNQLRDSTTELLAPYYNGFDDWPRDDSNLRFGPASRPPRSDLAPRMNSSPAFSSQPRVAPYLDSRDDRFYGYTPPGQMSFKPRSASRSTSNRTDVDAGLRSATGAERDQVDLRNFIFSGFLHKKSRLGYFQRRLFRFDGLLLICLSPKRHRLPEHINLLTFDPARHGSNQYATEFAAALRRFYPTDPPMPALTNPLIASYSADGNPEVFAKYYHIPKWIIPTSSILSVQALSLPTNDARSRTFIVNTEARSYVLRSETKAEFDRWCFLLSRMSARGGDAPMPVQPAQTSQLDGDNDPNETFQDYSPGSATSTGGRLGNAAAHHAPAIQPPLPNGAAAVRNHQALHQMGVWHKSVADLLRSDEAARSSLVSVATSSSEVEEPVDGLTSRKKEPSHPAGIDSIRPVTFIASERRVMKGLTLFGAALEAGLVDLPEQDAPMPGFSPFSQQAAKSMTQIPVGFELLPSENGDGEVEPTPPPPKREPPVFAVSTLSYGALLLPTCGEFEEASRADFLHACDATRRVVLRLLGEDAESPTAQRHITGRRSARSDGGLAPPKTSDRGGDNGSDALVFPGEDFTVRFAERALPALFSRLDRGLAVRVRAFQEWGARGAPGAAEADVEAAAAKTRLGPNALVVVPAVDTVRAVQWVEAFRARLRRVQDKWQRDVVGPLSEVSLSRRRLGNGPKREIWARVREEGGLCEEIMELVGEMRAVFPG